MMALFGAILPRFVLLVGWSNDQAGWGAVFGSPVWLLGGFLFFPWTTLVYGLAQQNAGMSLLNWIFLGSALAIDLGTWGVGFFASRKQVSSYRGT
jgi:hypothetical protein